MPALCPDCGVGNPPESRFCHECGAGLLTGGAPAPAPLSPRAPMSSSLPAAPSSTEPASPSEPGRATGIRDIGSDLKTLGADLADYSAPRIKRGSVATAHSARSVGSAVGRGARALAVVVASRIRSSARRLKPYRPERQPPMPMPMPENHAPAHQVADDGDGTPSYPLAPPAPAGSAVACPRCHRISEPGSLFCFSCGLPLDDALADARHEGWADTDEPAGLLPRFIAWVIDFIILVTLQMVIIAIWPGFMEYLAFGDGLHPVDLLVYALAALYYAVTVSVWAGTIGKRALGLYVVRPDGRKVGFGRALARYFAGNLSLLLFGVGYLMILLRRDRRGLHDLICDTAVVRQ